MRKFASLLGLAALLSAQAAQAQMDPSNPSCPTSLNVSNYREMRFTPQEVDGRRVLLAEGYIDDGTAERLQAALDANPEINEIWFRSPGGDAREGNEAGRIIRDNGMITRIPQGWTCFSACNFMFMGGMARFVDPGGIFMVHMFTHTQDRDAIRGSVARGEDSTIGLIAEVEQSSALLATQDNDFLIRMGVSRDLLTNVMYQVPSVANAQSRETRRCLSQQEVLRYNVATEIIEQDRPGGNAK
ncbi:hypothetical protein [Sphingosinicella terrae]|jgi:hypothetical protein|uniref:COG3904 family protein n=1 Tax=Sphingosinicella terrae TaxID=2172047 RepID=UPI0025490973|nr:hypothetical protein [Sphingosinicella terrae]